MYVSINITIYPFFYPPGMGLVCCQVPGQEAARHPGDYQGGGRDPTQRQDVQVGLANATDIGQCK